MEHSIHVYGYGKKKDLRVQPDEQNWARSHVVFRAEFQALISGQVIAIIIPPGTIGFILILALLEIQYGSKTECYCHKTTVYTLT